MRLRELFEDITPMDIRQIQRKVNQEVFAPQSKLSSGEPVVQVTLPVGDPIHNRPSHFFQRAWERDISPDEIERALHIGAVWHEDELEDIAAEDNPKGEIEFYDPESHVLIPAIVKPNENCRVRKDGTPYCIASGGRQPKNTLVAKTIIRKGEPDVRKWGD